MVPRLTLQATEGLVAANKHERIRLERCCLAGKNLHGGEWRHGDLGIASQCLARIHLVIQVDEQDALTFGGQEVCKLAGDRALANTSFLVGQGQGLHLRPFKKSTSSRTLTSTSLMRRNSNTCGVE